jgi:hypothetical protein
MHLETGNWKPATPPEGRVPPPGETWIRRVRSRGLQTRHPVILTSCPHPFPSPAPFASSRLRVRTTRPPGQKQVHGQEDPRRRTVVTGDRRRLSRRFLSTPVSREDAKTRRRPGRHRCNAHTHGRRSDEMLTPASLKTQRRQDRKMTASALPPFAASRLCVSQSGRPRASRFHPSPLTSEQVHHRHETYPNAIPPTAPFAASRLRVSPFGLNPRRMAAKIAESRKRTLFPSDEAAEPTHPRRTMSPPGNPSHHASASGSASASVSKTHGEEPGSIPIRLGPFGPSQSIAPGPEGRQTVAQCVSAGFRPPHENQPRRGDRSLFLRDRQQSLAASNVFAERQTHALFPFASSRLRVRPSGLNSRSMAAKITESRKRTLFPSDMPPNRHTPGGR